MRRVLAFAAFAPAAAFAQLPGPGTDLTVHVVDESRRPLPNAFVVAREFVNVPQLHGSRTYCERADVAAVTREAHAVRLPGAGLSRLVPGRTHALEAFAYAPGYCVERTAPAPGADVWLRATRAGSGDDRLEYLAGFSESLACGEWSGRSREQMAKLAQAMQAEADAIAATRYGKLLARRMRERLAAGIDAHGVADDAPRVASASMRQPFARDFIIAPANASIRFPREGEPNAMVAMAVRRGNDSQPVIHCRHGAPSSCDLDERDWQGYTMLYSSVGALDVDSVKLLLDAGASPSATVNAYGVDSIDALLRRAISNPPASGSLDAGKAIAIMELIAASPKASIRASLAEQLALDPSQWSPKAPESLALLKEARLRWAALPRRPDPASACEPMEPARAGARALDAMPVRLKRY